MSTTLIDRTLPAARLSQLIIDADKDWGGKAICNVVLQGVLLGDYASTTLLDDDGDHKLGDVIPPPPAVPGPKLLTADNPMSLFESVSWQYYNDGGYLGVQYTTGVTGWTVTHVTTSPFGDKNFRSRAYFSATWIGLFARLTDKSNFYAVEICPGLATKDHELYKVVAGTKTVLAYEAVDLAGGLYDLVISAIGTALKSSRDGGATFPLSATDTSFSSGKWGFGYYDANSWFRPISFGSPPPPAPKTLGYYEVPIIGDGSMDNPFRAALPELIEIPTTSELDGYPPELVTAIKANKGGAVNRPALTHSALIPTGPDGKPLWPTCIVRVFEQPDRQPHLWKLPEVLARLETQRAIPVRKLDVAQAIARAKEMDPKLSDFDFYAMPSPSDDEVRKYIEWRRATFGVETRYEDAKHYLESDKGWA